MDPASPTNLERAQTQRINELNEEVTNLRAAISASVLLIERSQHNFSRLGALGAMDMERVLFQLNGAYTPTQENS